MEFHKDSIDFEKTLHDYLKKHVPFNSSTRKYDFKSVSGKRFGLPLVRMAKAVITDPVGAESITGIQRCFEYEISEIKWYDHIWFIPFPWGSHWPLQSPRDRELIAQISDSLFLNIVANQVQLNEHHTGLADIIFRDLVFGLELVLDWIDRGIEVDPKKNELIAVIDIDHVKSFIR